MKKTLFVVAIILAIFLSPFSSIAALSPLQEKVLEVMKMEHRDEADKIRDRNRRPLRALEFFGLKPLVSHKSI